MRKAHSCNTQRCWPSLRPCGSASIPNCSRSSRPFFFPYRCVMRACRCFIVAIGVFSFNWIVSLRCTWYLIRHTHCATICCGSSVIQLLFRYVCMHNYEAMHILKRVMGGRMEFISAATQHSSHIAFYIPLRRSCSKVWSHLTRFSTSKFMFV